MILERRHQIGASGVIQGAGLVVLIGFIYRHFGPGAPGPVTPAVMAILAAGVFLLLWPMSLKAKH
jgi:hypothetical protein